MQNRIDIVMATYNGAAYISQQVRSLQNQTIKDWLLLIHDDGSTDDTVSIIKALARDDNRIRLIEDGKCLHNSGLNFMHTLSYSTAPYSIFCDQDDIWLEHKLEVLLNAFKNVNDKVPTAVACNSYMYFEDQELIEGKVTLSFPSSLKEALFMNGGIQGCAIMFNKTLRDICLNMPNYIAMHDHLLTLAALTFGDFKRIDQRLMLYRRHKNTVTDLIDGSKRQKAKKFWMKGKTVLDSSHLKAIISFCRKYNDIIPKSKKTIFEDFLKMRKYNRVQCVVHVLIKNYKVIGSRWILAIKILTRQFE